jgi:hypothetical protein
VSGVFVIHPTGVTLSAWLTSFFSQPSSLCPRCTANGIWTRTIRHTIINDVPPILFMSFYLCVNQSSASSIFCGRYFLPSWGVYPGVWRPSTENWSGEMRELVDRYMLNSPHCWLNGGKVYWVFWGTKYTTVNQWFIYRWNNQPQDWHVSGPCKPTTWSDIMRGLEMNKMM